MQTLRMDSNASFTNVVFDTSLLLTAAPRENRGSSTTSKTETEKWRNRLTVSTIQYSNNTIFFILRRWRNNPMSYLTYGLHNNTKYTYKNNA